MEFISYAHRGWGPDGWVATWPRAQAVAKVKAKGYVLYLKQKTYICIDLKSFYASVECADRGLDPFTTNLVVADPTRSENTICLAITPAMKEAGVRNRCRVREIPKGVAYLTAMPRMRRYMEVSKQIYKVYLRYVSTEDIYPYSIDECFIDATPYLRLYDIGAKEFAERLRASVLEETGVTATAGIGSNMFLAKVALDITAKHTPDGIGMLDEETFKRELWFHQPITDVWGIGPGIARRLAKYGAYDLAGVCAIRPQTLYKEFGKNAEYLIDHAWGQETATLAQVRSYVPKGHSINSGQVLMRDYSFNEARTILREMVDDSVLELVEKGLACNGIGLYVGYSRTGIARDDVQVFDGGHGLRLVNDVDGGKAPVLSAYGGGSHKLPGATNSESELMEAFLALYDKTVAREAAIRRVNISFTGILPESQVQPTLFDACDVPSEMRKERERRLADAVVAARGRFGANAVLRGTSLKQEANARERNNQIGGHRA